MIEYFLETLFFIGLGIAMAVIILNIIASKY